MRRSSLTPDIRWNDAAGRYVDAKTSRFISAAKVRAALDDTLDRAERGIKKTTEALRTGQMTLAAWQTTMATEVKNVHLASAALAKGGWASMDAAAYGRTGAPIRLQYGYLRNFANEIANGTQKLDGTLTRRAGMYVQAGRGTYHRVERAEMERRGMTQESNLRYAGDSCDGCVSASAAGWVAIGTLTPIGSRDCLTRCRCRLEYRAGEAE